MRVEALSSVGLSDSGDHHPVRSGHSHPCKSPLHATSGSDGSVLIFVVVIDRAHRGFLPTFLSRLMLPFSFLFAGTLGSAGIFDHCWSNTWLSPRRSRERAIRPL